MAIGEKLVTTSGWAGCRLREQVTVVDLGTHTAARGPTLRYAKVQTPDGSTQEAEDGTGDLFSVIYIGEQLNAEVTLNTKSSTVPGIYAVTMEGVTSHNKAIGYIKVLAP